MIPATLVTGTSPARREAAIAAAIAARLAMPSSQCPDTVSEIDVTDRPVAKPVAVLLEGFPTGKQDTLLTALISSWPLRLVRIAAGCLCCTGNLTMRVTLNRLLREQPPAAHLFIAMDAADHLPALRTMLETAPYSNWLALTADLEAD